MRDHQPVVFDQFNGLYNRGNIEEVPLDHFYDCNNIKFIGNDAYGTRDGIDIYQTAGTILGNALRVYNYPTTTGNTFLVLTKLGKIYHVVSPTSTLGPILTIASMTDFGFVSYNGRAYITPFTTSLVGNLNVELGVAGEFLYVYKGDGSAARKAASTAPPAAPAINVADAGPGFTDFGNKLFGVVFESDTGYLSSPGALSIFYTDAVRCLNFSAIPLGPVGTVKRHIVASKNINNYNGDVQGYDLFFIPGAVINDNVTVVLNTISFYDADLIDDASHLFDNYTQIPAGVNLSLYHNRLVLTTPTTNQSLVLVSAVGEPEAFNQIDGFCIVPPNGDPITNSIELRDVLYVLKRNKTVSFVDNGLEPSAWPITIIDNAMGCGVHGIATVLDSGSSNIDFILVGTYTGLLMFNGRYILPELTFKISSIWTTQNFKTLNRNIQILNDSAGLRLFIVKTDRTMLYADYSNGLDPKKVRWSPWSFNAFVNSIALTDINTLVFAMDQV